MLIRFTVAWLAVYLPLETFASVMGRGILTFGYLIDVVGMALMAWGVLAVQRRAAPGLGVLAAGWAWTSANFWRGTMERFWAMSEGRGLQFGSIELWLGPCLTALAILALFATLREGSRVGAAKN